MPVHGNRFLIRSIPILWVVVRYVLFTGGGGLPMAGQAPKLDLLDAVGKALAQHPQIAAQRAQIEISKGAKAIETGAFDTLLQSGLNHKLTTSPPLLVGDVSVGTGTDEINQTNFSIGGTKLYRNGISVNPFYQLTRTTDSYYYPSGYNSSTAGITVNVPLLRGRGSKVVAARERAAEMEIRASQHDFDFLLASLASSVAQSYWTVVSAYKYLNVARSAEARARTYVENTQAFIDADHVPRSDINQVRANLAQRTAARISAENALVVASQQLSRTIGLSAEEILLPLGEPADDFPQAPPNAGLASYGGSALHQQLSEALARRADYLAALERKEKLGILLPAAQNALRPTLDFSFGGGYQGLRGGRAVDDLLLSPFSGVVGPTASAGLSYSYPIRNHAAIGFLQQTQASILQADVAAKESARSISEALTIAGDNVRSAVLRIEQSRVTVALTQEALEGAKEKYRGGFGSVVEILQIEDRLNSAFGDQVQARLDYALALTQHRFAVGSLVPTNQQVPIIRKEAFTEPISDQWP